MSVCSEPDRAGLSWDDAFENVLASWLGFKKSKSVASRWRTPHSNGNGQNNQDQAAAQSHSPGKPRLGGRAGRVAGADGGCSRPRMVHGCQKTTGTPAISSATRRQKRRDRQTAGTGADETVMSGLRLRWMPEPTASSWAGGYYGHAPKASVSAASCAVKCIGYEAWLTTTVSVPGGDESTVDPVRLERCRTHALKC